MHAPVVFNEQGAHFRVATSNFAVLDELARAEFGRGLPELPIGKAAMLLRVLLLAAAADAIIHDEHGRTIVSTEMDGKEATQNVLAQFYEPFLKRSVMDIGRLSVEVIRSEEIDRQEAAPVLEFEVVSNAHKWAKAVVASHRDALYQDNDIQPTLNLALYQQMPQRAETALEIQGLTMQAQPDNESIVQLVRIPKDI